MSYPDPFAPPAEPKYDEPAAGFMRELRAMCRTYAIDVESRLTKPRGAMPYVIVVEAADPGRSPRRVRLWVVYRAWLPIVIAVVLGFGVGWHDWCVTGWMALLLVLNRPRL